MKRHFNNKILLRENMTALEIRKAVDFSLFLGLHHVSAAFPIAGRDGDLSIPVDPEAWREYMVEGASENNPDFIPVNAPKDFMAPREGYGLESLFLRGRILADNNGDFLPDAIDLKLILPDHPSTSQVISACNLAFRLGMETTGFSGSILGDSTYLGNRLTFVPGEKVGLKMEGSPDLKEDGEEKFSALLYGEGEELETFVSALCTDFPTSLGPWNLADVLSKLSKSLERRDFYGQLAFLKDRKVKGYLSYGPEDLSKINESFPDLELNYHKNGQMIHEKTMDLPWEVDVLKEELEEIYPRIHQGDFVFLQMAISEGKDVRNRLQKEIQNRLEELGVKDCQVQLFNSFKQGYSWIEESILPKAKNFLKEGKSSEKLKFQILFKPFLPEGEKEWKEEMGAIPTYGADKNMLGKWLDLPIRFLQELYPVADVIQRELGISKEDIIFEKWEEAEATYLVRVICDEEILVQESYQVPVDERNYLQEFPEMGLVHPSTGYLRGRVFGKENFSFNKRIKTDMEAIWDIYQGVVLPDLMDFIGKKVSENVEASQPFFSKLQLNIHASEPDERLNFREDMISSLDALHEDIYFTGLEYLKCHGSKLNRPLDAPGLILPVIRQREGKPSFSYTLWDHQSMEPYYVQEGEAHPLIASERVYAYVEEVYWKEGLTLALRLIGVEWELVQSYGELMKQGLIPLADYFGKYSVLELRTEKGSLSLPVYNEISREKTLDIRKIDLMENQVIGYEDYRRIIRDLTLVEGIQITEAGESFLGKKIYSIWLTPSGNGYVSQNKRLALYPSILINARHHANEVSGTNGSFMLLRELLTNPKYRDLGDEMNLVICPMENVDGTEIHYELQRDNPYWSLHTARFNALGREFAKDYFQEDTIHTEALAVSSLWEKYLPDIYIDNHGVPSHEWTQPFSGYTAPAYKGFWLPRSLIYGYFWTIGNEEYSQNILPNKIMEDVIASTFEEDAEITSWNKDWIWQFENYAHRWMPKQYPADYYKNMINYWISFDYDPAHKYMSIRYPWITTISYTSEVADETAQGEYLHLCARTHMTHDLATIDLARNSKLFFDKKYIFGEEMVAVLNRLRPLSFTGKKGGCYGTD